jgi:hypothetical protein
MIVSHGDVFTLQGTEGYGHDVFIAEGGDQGPADIKPGPTHAKIVSPRIFARLKNCPIEEVEQMLRAYAAGEYSQVKLALADKCEKERTAIPLGPTMKQGHPPAAARRVADSDHQVRLAAERLLASRTQDIYDRLGAALISGIEAMWRDELNHRR